MTTVALLYVGPAQQSNTDVAAATGEPAQLEPGKVYTVPLDLAVELQRSTPYWLDQDGSHNSYVPEDDADAHDHDDAAASGSVEDEPEVK